MIASPEYNNAMQEFTKFHVNLLTTEKIRTSIRQETTQNGDILTKQESILSFDEPLASLTTRMVSK